MKIQKIILLGLTIFACQLSFGQKKTTSKKPKVTVQKPAEKEETKTTPPPAVIEGAETAKPTTTIPMAEREQIVIPTEQPKVAEKTSPAPARKKANPAAERAALADSLSVHPIDPSNVLYRITNWRRMDLKEKINQPFFAKNSEITKFLIEGVRSGVLTPYANDSLLTTMSLETFNQNLLMEDMGGDGLSEEEKKAGFGSTDAGADDGWGVKPSTTTPSKGTKPAATGTQMIDDGWGNMIPAPGSKPAAGAATTTGSTGAGSGNTGATGAAEYFARDLTILEIKEDFVFDKQRSRAYNSIHAITIIIPAEKTVKGFDVPVASFKYKELDRYFRSNPKCIWYNFRNITQHKSMADAFDLRLFNARIIKQSNPTDSYLVDLYKGEKAGLQASELMEYRLMEFEHNLWEY